MVKRGGLRAGKGEGLIVGEKGRIKGVKKRVKGEGQVKG